MTRITLTAERAQLATTIKHFEALQKRYTRQHNGTACEHVKMALIGLKRLLEQPDVVRCKDCRYVLAGEFGDWYCSCMYNDEGEQLSMAGADFCSYGERRKEQDDG